MRLAGFFLLLAALAACPAAAQQPTAPAGRPAAPAAPPVAPAPRAAQSFANGGTGNGLIGLQPVRPLAAGGLVGMGPADVRPQCRATCAKDRNLCSGDGDDGCDTRWIQCVSACRTAR